MAGRRPHSDPEQEQQKASSKHPTTRWRGLLALTLAALLVVTAGCSGLGAGGDGAAPVTTTPPAKTSVPSPSTAAPTDTPEPTVTETATATPEPTPTTPDWVDSYQEILSAYTATGVDPTVSWVNDSVTRVTASVDLGVDYTTTRKASAFPSNDYRAYPYPVAELAAHAYAIVDTPNQTTIQITYKWNSEPALSTQLNATTAHQFHDLDLSKPALSDRLLADATRLSGHPDVETGSFITFTSPYAFAPQDKVMEAEVDEMEERLTDRLSTVGLAGNITDVYRSNDPFYYENPNETIAFHKPIVIEATVPYDRGESLDQYNNTIDNFRPTPGGFVTNATLAETANILGGKVYGETPTDMVLVKEYDLNGSMYAPMAYPYPYAEQAYNPQNDYTIKTMWAETLFNEQLTGWGEDRN